MADVVIKVALIGNYYTGKTSLGRMIAGERVGKEFISTIGVDMFSHYYKSGSNRKIKIHIWDLAGSSHFRPITDSYIPCCQILLFVFSGDNYDSFIQMVARYEDMKEKGMLDRKNIAIVVSKIDLCPDKSFEKWLRPFSIKYGLETFLTSSYQKIGKEELIEWIVGDYDWIEPVVIKEDRRCCTCAIV